MRNSRRCRQRLKNCILGKYIWEFEEKLHIHLRSTKYCNKLSYVSVILKQGEGRLTRDGNVRKLITEWGIRSRRQSWGSSHLQPRSPNNPGKEGENLFGSHLKNTDLIGRDSGDEDGGKGKFFALVVWIRGALAKASPRAREARTEKMTLWVLWAVYFFFIQHTCIY